MLLCTKENKNDSLELQPEVAKLDFSESFCK